MARVMNATPQARMKAIAEAGKTRQEAWRRKRATRPSGAGTEERRPKGTRLLPRASENRRAKAVDLAARGDHGQPFLGGPALAARRPWPHHEDVDLLLDRCLDGRIGLHVEDRGDRHDAHDIGHDGLGQARQDLPWEFAPFGERREASREATRPLPTLHAGACPERPSRQSAPLHPLPFFPSASCRTASGPMAARRSARAGWE